MKPWFEKWLLRVTREKYIANSGLTVLCCKDYEQVGSRVICFMSYVCLRDEWLWKDLRDNVVRSLEFSVGNYTSVIDFITVPIKEKKKRYYEMLRTRLSLHHFKSWHFCLMWSISIVHIIIQWDKLLYKIFGSKSEHFTKLLYLNNTHTHRVVEKAWGLSP